MLRSGEGEPRIPIQLRCTQSFAGHACPVPSHDRTAFASQFWLPPPRAGHQCGAVEAAGIKTAVLARIMANGDAR